MALVTSVTPTTATDTRKTNVAPSATPSAPSVGASLFPTQPTTWSFPVPKTEPSSTFSDVASITSATPATRTAIRETNVPPSATPSAPPVGSSFYLTRPPTLRGRGSTVTGSKLAASTVPAVRSRTCAAAAVTFASGPASWNALILGVVSLAMIELN